MILPLARLKYERIAQNWQADFPEKLNLKRKEVKAAMRKTYAERKEEIREQAIYWQVNIFPNDSWSYGELAEIDDYFETMGKRYGLLTEFHENGIC